MRFRRPLRWLKRKTGWGTFEIVIYGFVVTVWIWLYVMFFG